MSSARADVAFWGSISGTADRVTSPRPAVATGDVGPETYSASPAVSSNITMDAVGPAVTHSIWSPVGGLNASGVGAMCSVYSLPSYVRLKFGEVNSWVVAS